MFMTCVCVCIGGMYENCNLQNWYETEFVQKTSFNQSIFLGLML